MKQHSSKLAAPRSEASILPLDLGLAEAAKAYGRRLLALMLAALVALAFIALYALVYKLGLRTLYFLVPFILGGLTSLLLARIEDSTGTLRTGLTRLPQAIRYAIERLLAITLLILLAPVFLVIAFAIKVDSKGPVFVRRTKVGRYGRPFSRLTFRTVADPDPYDERDPRSKAHTGRVMGLGTFLRSTGLDDLPMLINVAKGEMALFGDPPENPNDLLESGPLYLPRLMWRPGVVRVHSSTWSERVPSELHDVWIRVRGITTSGTNKEEDSKVFLVQVARRSLAGADKTDTSHWDTFVFSFRIDDFHEQGLERRLDEIGVSIANALAGHVSQSAALIEAAWTAWGDLPSRYEDKPLSEVEPSEVSGGGVATEEKEGPPGTY